MMRRIFVFALLFAITGLGWSRLELRSTLAAPSRSGPESPFKPVGLVGCGSANCHGKPGEIALNAIAPDAWKKSCGVWTSVDPHAGAYAVLDPEQNIIARRMQDAFRKLEPNYSTQKDTRCLACHSNPTLADESLGMAPAPFLTALRAEGVSCEACHGNAQAWQGPHTGWTTAEKRTQGMRDAGMPELNDIGTRAKMCTGCHVGAPADPARGYPARDMNHDMIAAGHPRLVFEYASHFARLPKHWYERDRSAPGSPPRGTVEFARNWLLGSLATAEAQAELTADRAERGQKDTARTQAFAKLSDPWPELAEWNCYACHHNLLPKSWRSTPQAIGSRFPGKPTWELPWPLSQTASSNQIQAGLGDRMAPLVKDLTKSTDAKAVAKAATDLAALLAKERQELAGLDYRQAMQRLHTLFESSVATDKPLHWDDMYRLYLSLTVTELARRDMLKKANQPLTSPEIAEDLLKLSQSLRLPQHPLEEQRTPAETKKILQRLISQLTTETQTLTK